MLIHGGESSTMPGSLIDSRHGEARRENYKREREHNTLLAAARDRVPCLIVTHV